MSTTRVAPQVSTSLRVMKRVANSRGGILQRPLRLVARGRFATLLTSSLGVERRYRDLEFLARARYGSGKTALLLA